MLRFALVLAFAGLVAGGALASEPFHPRVRVVDPYLELRTGPGVDYPVYYVIDRGETVEVLQRRTNWFEVRASNGKRGWVTVAQLERTLTPSGETMTFSAPTLEDFQRRQWEAGITSGYLDGYPTLGIYGDHFISHIYSAEAQITRYFGEFANAWLANISVVAEPYRKRKYSPYFAAGLGLLRRDPGVTLVEGRDRQDPTAHVGIGVRAYLSRRFAISASYRRYQLFTDNGDEVMDQWQGALGVFF